MILEIAAGIILGGIGLIIIRAILIVIAMILES